MKRFHIALAVNNLDDSIRDYSQRLGKPPTAIVAGKYAMWRTEILNFSINQMPEKAGQLRHIGFEDSTSSNPASTFDVNGIEWESFTPEEQDKRIIDTYGTRIA